MKKELYRLIALVSMLAVGCAATVCVAGCKKEASAKSYYNKTVTFTGNAFHSDINANIAFDNYGNLGDTSYQKIAETYWDEIDWELSGIETPPASADKFATLADSYNPYTNWKNISFTVTKDDSLTITLNLPAAFSSWGWGTSVTMPLYEDKTAFTNALNDSSYFVPDLNEPGYMGMGFKSDGDKRLIISVHMVLSNDGKTKRDSAILTLTAQQKRADEDYYDNVGYLNTSSLDLLTETEGGSQSVLSLSYYPEITITDKK